MKKRPIIAAFLLGVNAMLAQAILIRELLVNFSGNELTMGIMLAVWLIAGAIGILLIARITIDAVKEPDNLFAYCLMLLSLIIPVTVFLSRTVRAILRIPIYEMLGPAQVLCASSIIIFPVSFLVSISFILCLKAAAEASDKKAAPGLVYVFEGLGAMAAGSLFTFLLVRYLNPFQVISGLLIVNISFILLKSRKIRKKLTMLSGAALLLSLALLLITSRLPDVKSQQIQWQPQKVLSYVNSIYGNITATSQGESVSLYENGSLLFTNQDTAFCEEFAHLAMLQHKNPKSVLLIGGGIGGLLRQILKHNPQKVTYLELDPSVVDISSKYISDNDRAALSDHRVDLINEDGRFFIERSADKFDVIIVNLPDPTTLQLNRFYTKEFYQRARSCLNKDGILACRASSRESVISDEMARYNSSLYKTLQSAFTSVATIPGEEMIFISSDNIGILHGRPQVLMDRFKDRKIKADFLTRYRIKDRYYPYSIGYLMRRINSQYNKAVVNSDFHPICFYYDIVLWSIRFYPHLVNTLNMILRIKTIHILGLLFILSLAAIALAKTRRDPLGFLIPAVISLSGGIGITLEIIIILSFQISYGYVYGKVGLLISLFMLGLAAGAYIMNSSLGRIKDQVKTLSYILFCFSSYAFLLPIIIKGTDTMPLEAAKTVFYIIMLLAGMAVGSQFPIAVAVMRNRRSGPRATSIVWGADLLGSCAGILISSLIIIPVLGIFDTALICAACGGAVFILLNLFRQRPLR